jgi:NitT/TauT family transport system permease protein
MPDIDLIQLGKLTRRELKELEEKEKTPIQKVFEVIIMLLPIVCGAVALLEYLMLPDLTRNNNPIYRAK